MDALDSYVSPFLWFLISLMLLFILSGVAILLAVFTARVVTTYVAVLKEEKSMLSGDARVNPGPAAGAGGVEPACHGRSPS